MCSRVRFLIMLGVFLLAGAYPTNARMSRIHAKFVYTDWGQAIKFD